MEIKALGFFGAFQAFFFYGMILQDNAVIVEKAMKAAIVVGSLH